MNGRYDDLLHLPHPTSTDHPQMSIHDRAAQFSPFSALTGYHAVIQEAARQTEQKRELDEAEQAELNRKLQFLRDHLQSCPKATLCYFQPDVKKAGGAYHFISGVVKQIDIVGQTIALMDGTVIPLDDLWSIDCGCDTGAQA